jgi:hypothetical protein
MPAQDYPEHSPEAVDSPLAQTGQAPPPSRRTVLRRAAGVSAAGLAVAAGGSGVVAALMSSHSQADAASDAASGAAGSGPIVIYMADPRSGEMEIFRGTQKVSRRDRAMTSMAIKMAPR